MDELKSLLKNKSIRWVIFIILLFPILANIFVFSWGTSITHGELNSWIGFFATYYGAIVGGVISGALTLLGVRLTITQQQEIVKRQEAQHTEEKYNVCKFIFSEIHYRIIALETAIKSLSLHEEKYYERINNVSKTSEELISKTVKLFPEAASVSPLFLESLRTVSWTADGIRNFIDDSNKSDTPKNLVIEELQGRLYQRLAESDVGFDKAHNKLLRKYKEAQELLNE